MPTNESDPHTGPPETPAAKPATVPPPPPPPPKGGRSAILTSPASTPMAKGTTAERREDDDDDDDRYDDDDISRLTNAQLLATYGTVIGCIASRKNLTFICGGAPDLDWTKPQCLVDNPDKPYTKRSFACIRSDKHGMKEHEVIIKQEASVKPFKPEGLYQFGTDLLKTFCMYGIDSTSYVRPMYGGERRLCVLTDFDQLTKSHVIQMHQLDSTKWSAMDFSNDNMALDKLKNHLPADIKAQIDPYLDLGETTPLVVYWMHLVSMTSTAAHTKRDQLRTEIKSLKLTNYAGSNVHEFTAAFATKARELDSGKGWDWTDLDHLITALSADGLPMPFAIEANSYSRPLKEAYVAIAGLSYADKNKYMLAKELHWNNLCQALNTLYGDLKAKGCWPAAVTVKDTKTPAAEFNLASLKSMPTQDLLALIQSGELNNLVHSSINKRVQQKMNQNEKQDSESRDDSGSGGGNGGGGDRRRGPRNGKASKGFKKRNTDDAKQAWKTTPPASGEAETKKKGKHEFFWCAQCKRWTTSHSTAEHKGTKKSEATEANCFYVTDPSAFFDGEESS